MKLKHFLVIFCLFGAGFLQLSAQNGNKDNGNQAVSFWEDVYWVVDVYCGEEWTDFIVGYGTVHFVYKFKNGELVYVHANCNITAEGANQEVFKYIEVDKVPLNPEPGILNIQLLNYQLIGDQGSHYVGFLTAVVYDDGTFELIPGKNHCL